MRRAPICTDRIADTGAVAAIGRDDADRRDNPEHNKTNHNGEHQRSHSNGWTTDHA